MKEDRPFEDFGPEVGGYQEEIEDKDGDVNVLDMAKKYAVLNEQKKQLEKQLENVKDAMKRVNDAICDAMILDNPNIKVRVNETADGRPIFKTVYVKSTIWAGFSAEVENGKEKLVNAIKESGLSEMVNESYNTQSLSSYVRGLNPDTKDLDELYNLVPDSMRPFIKLTKVINLAVK